MSKRLPSVIPPLDGDRNFTCYTLSAVMLILQHKYNLICCICFFDLFQFQPVSHSGKQRPESVRQNQTRQGETEAVHVRSGT